MKLVIQLPTGMTAGEASIVVQQTIRELERHKAEKKRRRLERRQLRPSTGDARARVHP